MKKKNDSSCIQACVQIFCDDCPFGNLGELLTQEEADKRTKMVMTK